MIEKSSFLLLVLAIVLVPNLMLTNGLRNGAEFRRTYVLENDPKRSLTLIKETTSIGINKLSACKVELDDGKIIDLSGLDNAASPKIDDEGNYVYKYNPCSPITCTDTSKNAAACQVSQDGKFKFNLGDQSTASFKYDSAAGLVMTFNSGEEGKTSIINCLCSSGNQLKFIRESPLNTYNMQFKSECCCPDKCKGGKKGDSGGLTFGSILVIIFFSLLGAYLIGGILFMKFAKHKTGLDMIPNREIWSEMPGNVKAGFSFTVSKIRGGNSGYQPV